MRSLSGFSTRPTNLKVCPVVRCSSLFTWFVAAFCFQAIRHEMQRLPPRDKPSRSREEGEGQGFPPELLHLPGMSQADEHRRGALRSGRQQVRLQAGLPVGQAAAGHASRARSSW